MSLSSQSSNQTPSSPGISSLGRTSLSLPSSPTSKKTSGLPGLSMLGQTSLSSPTSPTSSSPVSPTSDKVLSTGPTSSASSAPTSSARSTSPTAPDTLSTSPASITLSTPHTSSTRTLTAPTSSDSDSTSSASTSTASVTVSTAPTSSTSVTTAPTSSTSVIDSTAPTSSASVTTSSVPTPSDTTPSASISSASVITSSASSSLVTNSSAPGFSNIDQTSSSAPFLTSVLTSNLGQMIPSTFATLVMTSSFIASPTSDMAFSDASTSPISVKTSKSSGFSSLGQAYLSAPTSPTSNKTSSFPGLSTLGWISQSAPSSPTSVKKISFPEFPLLGKSSIISFNSTTSGGVPTNCCTSTPPIMTLSSSPTSEISATTPSPSKVSTFGQSSSTSTTSGVVSGSSPTSQSSAKTPNSPTSGTSLSNSVTSTPTNSSQTSPSKPTSTTPGVVSGRIPTSSNLVMNSSFPGFSTSGPNSLSTSTFTTSGGLSSTSISQGMASPTSLTMDPPGPDEFTGQPDEIACDICDPNNCRNRATKSCLMCSLSYCSTHLKIHQRNVRVKGHMLVAPCAEMDQRACSTHGRPLELYSVTEDRLICSLCVQERMKVISVEKEREKRQKTMNHEIDKMREKIQQREERINHFNQSAVTCVDLVKKEEEEIRKVFKDIKRLVNRAEKYALHPLVERRTAVETDVKDLVKDLQDEISKFKTTISILQQIRSAEDPIVFLQSYPNSIKLNKDKDWSNIKLNTSLTFGTMRNILLTMMDDTKTEFEKLSGIETSRIKKFAVDVTLDPDTANPQLNISMNRKEVNMLKDFQMETGIENDNGSDRFDVFGSILGSCCLTEGRAYWEVKVKNKRGWDIGVALEEANRKGELSLKPSQGYWVIVHYDDVRYAALEDSPVSLHLQKKPRRVGVFVDFQEKLVSFYDLEDKSHIYSFKDCDFGGGGIRPYFSPHLNHDEPLVICPEN